MRGKETIVAFLLGIATNLATEALTSQTSNSVAVQIETQRGSIVLVLVVLILAVVLAVSAYLQARRFAKRLDELFSNLLPYNKGDEVSLKRRTVGYTRQANVLKAQTTNRCRSFRTIQVHNGQTFDKHLQFKRDRTFITSLSFARYQRILALQQFYNKRHKENEIGS
jgi:predicted HAD superfamily phosphohydrolase